MTMEDTGVPSRGGEEPGVHKDKGKGDKGEEGGEQMPMLQSVKLLVNAGTSCSTFSVTTAIGWLEEEEGQE